uniref:Uncharacterized protein n=1 Tax=Sparus aurata TaxID=8175 RepID=A0A671WHR2_SPAAU
DDVSVLHQNLTLDSWTLIWKSNGLCVFLCVRRLERRWVLWHEFMKEHAHLDSWLRLAEQAVSSSNPALVTYVTAKDELRKFERLRCEAGSRLVQLDSLTRRNRTLTRLFQGAMKARLLASARECGQRWDDVNAKLESITGRLKTTGSCLRRQTLVVLQRVCWRTRDRLHPFTCRLLLPLHPHLPMSTWGWSGTPQSTSDARSPARTPTRLTSVPAQVGSHTTSFYWIF